ncbi:MAG TPA: hypothetical protein VGH27_24505 [Streptosporangiaceae bacterium]|jgi:hypothetical protein
MSTSSLVLGILVLCFVIYRQMNARPVRGDFRIPLVLGVIGVIQLADFLRQHHTSTNLITLGLLGSLVLAAVFGAARAMTTKVWMRNGQPWRQGNVLTAVLWAVGLGAHLGFDYLVYKHSSLGEVTIFLYLAVSFAVQRVILQARADRLPEGPGEVVPDEPAGC